MNSNSENRKASQKKAAQKRPQTWKKGQSGNPAGGPKRGQSWAEIIKRYGDMTAPEAAEHSLELAKQFLKIGDGLTLKEAVVLRVYGALLFDPDARLLNSFMDRAEGKVTQTFANVDWREEAKQRGYDPDELVRQFAAAMVARNLARSEGTSGGNGGEPDPLDASAGASDSGV